jgi:hypothetical protein
MAHLLPRRGRPGVLFMMTVDKELTQQDLLRIASVPAPRVAAPMIQRLKQRHHEAARLIATASMTLREISIRTGYSAQRLSDLQTRDPAFINLVSYYATQHNELAVDATVQMRETLLDISQSAAFELQDRLDDPVERKKMTVGELRQLVETGADRTVAPPRTAVPVATVPPKITFNIGTRDIKPKANIDGRDSALTIEVRDEDDS